MIIIKKSISYGLFFIALIFIITPAHSDEIDDDLREIAAITQDIKKNGPADIQCLPISVIRDAASSFVYGYSGGAISSASLSRMGGAKQATISLLRGEIAATGTQVCR